LIGFGIDDVFPFDDPPPNTEPTAFTPPRMILAEDPSPRSEWHKERTRTVTVKIAQKLRGFAHQTLISIW